MSERNQIRIDDLREPRLSEMQTAALNYAAGLKICFDEDDVLAEAMSRSGLSDFGSAAFRPRLRAQLGAIEADTGLTGLGRLILRRRMVGLLVARLRFEDFLRHHPEALEVELEPPIIVVGLPRSGTTHLVNLIAADQRFRALPWWECQEPFPGRGDGPGPDGVDPRFQRALASYEAETSMAPVTRAMHDRRPDAIEEECELLDLDFAGYTLEWHARVPGWRDFYFGIDQDASYAYLVRILKALTFLRGPRRWVLKTPQHLEQLGPLTRTFPEATLAFTLRDPVAVLQSAMTMLGYGDRVRRHEVGLSELAEYWTARIEQLLRAFVRDRDRLAPQRCVDVEFNEFMSDDVTMVERIFSVAGLDLPGAARRQLDAYMRGHPRGQHGQVVYDLKGDFGLRADELRERFAFYFERFPGVRAEV